MNVAPAAADTTNPNIPQSAVRIGLLGASGRMGQWVRKVVAREFQGRAAITVEASAGDPLELLLSSDVIIDFSSPEAMSVLARGALRLSGGRLPAFVVGSTGWTPEQMVHLEALARKARVLMASNFSTGIGLLNEILRQFAPALLRIGYQPAIVETHHKHKKDAPSGTAITLARSVNPTDPSLVQTLSLRAGEVIGDHDVSFFGPGDTITLRHHARDRSVFARGAVDAAIWLVDKPATFTGGAIIGLDAYLKEIQETPQS